MRIAVDAMGGDHAPAEIVRGALEASREHGIPIALIGRETEIAPLLTPAATQGADYALVDALEAIGPDEKPAQAVRQKRQSSIVLGIEQVREGRCDAFVSAGNTGALMTASLLGLGKIMRRPALGAVLPTFARRPVLLLDAGASVDARPEDLVEYAVVGSLYAEHVLHLPDPAVALLNIGLEESKGNELVRAAYQRLQNLPIRFVGNIEGREVLSGDVQVIVSDGFAGNVMLKTIEGFGIGIFALLRDELARGFQTKLGGLLVRERLREVGKTLDYATYGGAPLFGVRGPVIKCHGSSRALAVRNGVRVASEYVACGAVRRMEGALQQEGDA
ncbi:MAG: phosphate acyltransferase PlsX [Thermaerobacter sp.]|nr:phosphate acyltransferase PlsX [Thermaerobacter sp.]